MSLENKNTHSYFQMKILYAHCIIGYRKCDFFKRNNVNTCNKMKSRAIFRKEYNYDNNKIKIAYRVKFYSPAALLLRIDIYTGRNIWSLTRPGSGFSLVKK